MPKIRAKNRSTITAAAAATVARTTDAAELLCRTCLKSLRKKKYDIFALSQLSEWISSYASLDINKDDGLPKYLCHKCYLKIEEFHEFHKMCIESAEKYQQLYLTKIESSCNGNDANDDNSDMVGSLDTKNDVTKLLELSVTRNEIEMNDVNGDGMNEEHHQLDITHYNTNENEIIKVIKEGEINITKNTTNNQESPIVNDDDCNDSYKDDDDDEDEDYHANTNSDGDDDDSGNNSNDEDEYEYHDERTDVKKKIGRVKKGATRYKTKSNKSQYIKKDKSNKRTTGNNGADDSAVDGDGSGGNKKNQIVCKVCDKRHYKQEIIEACMRRDKGLKAFVCPECPKGYNELGSLRDHIKNIHKNCQMYECPAEGCDKIYSLKNSMRTHYKQIHSKELPRSQKRNKSFICEQCGKAFKTTRALNEHRYIHTGDFPYKCNQCPKRCSTKYQLEVHYKRHQGIKNYVCPICGLKKTTSTELKTHMNYHSRDKTFTCKFCPYTTCDKYVVLRHEKVVHQGIKAFKCKFCDKSLSKAETLKHHEMTHTGEKPHECNLCGRRFIQLSALKTHLKRHDEGTTKPPAKNKSAATKTVKNEAIDAITPSHHDGIVVDRLENTN